MKVIFKIITCVSLIICFACETTSLDEGVPPCTMIDENQGNCTLDEKPKDMLLPKTPDNGGQDNNTQSTVGEDSPVKPEDNEE
ncbi:MAG: hypothetical protein AAGB24_05715 [Bacteroidota bacterium]